MNSETFLYVFPVLFVAWWAFLVWLVSRVSGWARLAEKYPAQNLDDPAIRWKHWQNMSLQNWANYNNCVSVGVSPAGLSLRLPWLFRMGHPPVHIPWSAFDRQARGRWLWMGTISLWLREEPRTRIMFMGRTLEGAEAWLPPETQKA